MVIYSNSHIDIEGIRIFFFQQVVSELLVAWVWLSYVGLNGEYDYEYYG